MLKVILSFAVFFLSVQSSVFAGNSKCIQHTQELVRMSKSNKNPKEQFTSELAQTLCYGLNGDFAYSCYLESPPDLALTDTVVLCTGSKNSHASLDCYRDTETGLGPERKALLCQKAPSEAPQGPTQCYRTLSQNASVEAGVRLCQEAKNDFRGRCFNDQIGRGRKGQYEALDLCKRIDAI